MKHAALVTPAALLAGAVMVALAVPLDPTRAAYGWLTAVVLGYTIACGALVLLMIGYATDAVWLVVMRRPVEAIAGTIPLFAILFVPLLLAVGDVWPWAPGGLPMKPHEHEVVRHTSAWLNEPFFVLRSAAYLAVPVLLAEPLLYWSRAQDRDGKIRARSPRVLSAIGLPLLVVIVTFAIFDWVMSLEPAFPSTSFGLIPNAGGFAALLGIVAAVVALGWRGRFARVELEHTHALGKLMLASLCFWAYLAFTHYLIIWIADLPSEVRWQKPRVEDGWAAVGVAIIVGHLALPFAALLSRGLKRRPPLLAVVGVWLVPMHWLELWWFVLPAIRPEGPTFSLADPGAALVVAGGMTLVAALRLLGAPPLPRIDPLLSRALRYRAE